MEDDFISTAQPDMTLLSEAHFGDWDWIIREIASGSGRAAVLVIGAHLDDMLRLAIQTFLLPAAGKDDLLEGDNPLSTFSARTKIARRLGLIDDQTKQALDSFRRLRNVCAHQVRDVSFEHPPFRDRLATVASLFEHTSAFDLARTQLQGIADKDRITLAGVGVGLSSLLHVTVDRANSLREMISLARDAYQGVPMFNSLARRSESGTAGNISGTPASSD